jgi:thymidylate synthase ThyX
MSTTPDYQDAGHRPHARHDGEEPRNEITEAPYHLNVTLDTWGPVDNLFPTLYDKLVSNWGDAPSRSGDLGECYPLKQMGLDTRGFRNEHVQSIDHRTGWDRLNGREQSYVESCFAGKTLSQVLESITFSFLIDGCTRACTHQIVRARIGAGFMQHGGRDNDWRHRPWVMPETIRRAVEAHKAGSHMHGAPETPSVLNGKAHCIKDWKPIDAMLREFNAFDLGEPKGDLLAVIEGYLDIGRRLYSALVDAGIPWEDARRLLWMGTSTYIHADYNYLALQGLAARRLEFIMDWEINCVMQLMVREVNMKCPPIFGKYLRSASDIKGQAAFAGLQSWPPDGKYPNPYERCQCGHAKGNHDGGYAWCEVCHREKLMPECMDYRPVDSLPREHRPEQNPFWVLHPDSLAGGPIRWIPTNGTYPHSEVK